MSSASGEPSLNFSFENVCVSVSGRKGQAARRILDDVCGNVVAGEMLAIMGPSGSGKTTLLNELALRSSRRYKLSTQTQIHINGRPITQHDVESRMRYVESNDVLIGSLTVRETLNFAARLSLPKSATRRERQDCVDELLRTFGLTEQADTVVGTVTHKGISTGQKRRLSVASQMASAPQILLLDEPTSGLDSAASYSVMAYIKEAARAQNLIVICSIHQPSSTTFRLFDKLLLLSEGQSCYFGTVPEVRPYFSDIGYQMDLYTNPAEYILDLVNVEFSQDPHAGREKLAHIQQEWKDHRQAVSGKIDPQHSTTLSLTSDTSQRPRIVKAGGGPRAFVAVLHRSWIKSRRDVLVYGVRFGMYMGLAIMMGTVWLRLPPTQANIQAYANCILFGSAFMSFMAVVYVPAFVEDRQIYIKDRSNGLYGSTSFLWANFLIGLPYLFLIALCSSSFTYWMVDFRPAGDAFMYWVLWMYLNLLAAESLVVFIASLIPDFIGALALTAMANGIWMACNGFMVAPPALNVFWRYVFYYINYQAYVFRGLLTNEFAQRNYTCNSQCYCLYDTPLREQCLVQGSGVLEQQYGFYGVHQGKWIGITVGIIAVLRMFGWLALEFRR